MEAPPNELLREKPYKGIPRSEDGQARPPRCRQNALGRGAMATKRGDCGFVINYQLDS